MVESGFATHFLDGAQVVWLLEQVLAELPLYDHQMLKRLQVRHDGDTATFEDVFQKEDSIEGIVERMIELVWI